MCSLFAPTHTSGGSTNVKAEPVTRATSSPERLSASLARTSSFRCLERAIGQVPCPLHCREHTAWICALILLPSTRSFSNICMAFLTFRRSASASAMAGLSLRSLARLFRPKGGNRSRSECLLAATQETPRHGNHEEDLAETALVQLPDSSCGIRRRPVFRISTAAGISCSPPMCGFRAGFRTRGFRSRELKNGRRMDRREIEQAVRLERWGAFSQRAICSQPRVRHNSGTG